MITTTITAESKLTDLIDPWFDAHPLAETSRKTFHNAIRSFSGSIVGGHPATVADLSADAIKAWVFGGRSRHSGWLLRNYRARIRSLWQYAIDCGAAEPPKGALWLTTTGDVGALLDFFRLQYAPIRLATAANSTRRRYEADIQRLADYLGRVPRLSDLTPATIVGLCAELREDGRSPTTCNKVRSELVSLATFAAKRGLAAWPDNIPKQREYRRAPTAWDSSQLDRLFQSAAETEGEIRFVDGGDRKRLWHDTNVQHIPAGKWWVALLAVLWDSGARIGAVLKLEWLDIDFDRGTLILRAENQKQRADQVFRLHPDTLASLEVIADPERRLVFPWDFSAPTLWQHFRRILTRGNLPHGRRDMFHKVRRSVASHYEASGGDATRLLGHSGRAVTIGYLDTTICGARHPSDVLFRPSRAVLAKGGAA